LNLPADTIRGDPDGPPDVLSPEEESVLALLRNAVEGMRATGLPPEPDSVAGALGAARVLNAAGTEGPGGEYRANGARFALRRCAGGTGGIEVTFIPTAP
jgi:hypothetical protein